MFNLISSHLLEFCHILIFSLFDHDLSQLFAPFFANFFEEHIGVVLCVQFESVFKSVFLLVYFFNLFWGHWNSSIIHKFVQLVRLQFSLNLTTTEIALDLNGRGFSFLV
jgi:hypothetical protein